MMILIFIASSTPSSQLPNFNVIDTLVKKGGHMLGYALLACSYLYALRSNARRFPALPAVVLALLYAVSDEFHQSFIPGRHPSPLDVGIDLLGAILGLLAYYWFWLRRDKKSPSR